MFKDYIILQDYDSYWHEIFFFDHVLTNEDIERMEKAIQKVKDELPGEYSNEDVEQAIDKIVPYIDTLSLSETDDHKTIYF